MTGNLANRTIKGSIWSFLDNISNQGITFVVGLILARMLGPDEYGLIGIITIFIALFTTLADSGISTALIRDTNTESIDYDTAYWTNVVLGILMYFCLFIISPFIASFFHRSELVPLTRVMGMVLIINSFSIVQRTIFTKELNFKKQTIISLISSITSGFVGIVLAYIGWGVWSLVAQQITRQSLQTIFSWIYSNWSPSCRFSIISFHNMFNFGWKIMLSGAINTLWNEAYQIVIGRCYLPATLGQYTRAKQFADIFSTNITSVVQRVTFPSLAEIHSNISRMKNAYRRILGIVSIITFTLLFGLAGIADNLIYVLLGEQWVEAASFLPIICFQCLTYPVNSLNLNILMVKGRSDIYLYLEVVKKIFAVIPLLLGIFIDIYWMLWASVIYGVIAFILNAHFSGKRIGYSVYEQVKDLSPAFWCSLCMFVLVFSLNSLDMSEYLLLPLQILLGGCFIIVIFILTKNKDFLYLWNITKKLVFKYKG